MEERLTIRTSERNIDSTGKTLVTNELQALLDEAAGKGTLILTPGRYLTATLYLRSNTELVLEEGSELVATTDESQYKTAWTRVAGIMMEGYEGLITVRDAEHVTVRGKGTINGNGPYWWAKYWGTDCKGGLRAEYDPKGIRWAADYDVRRIRNVVVDSSKDITLKDFTSFESGFWNVHVLFSERVLVEGVHIKSSSPVSPSTDGIDIDSSAYVTVRECVTETNDDSICVKSGRDWDGWKTARPCHHIVIERCKILSGFGVTIGSEVSGGVHDITIRDMDFRGTDCGFRIKSSRARRGYIRDVLATDLRMVNVKYPVHINLDWNPAYSCCSLPDGFEGAMPPHWQKLLEKIPDSVPLTQVGNIMLSHLSAGFTSDYQGTSRALDIEGYEDENIKDLTLEKVSIKAHEFGIISGVSGLTLKDTVITASGNRDAANDDYDSR